LFYFNRYGSIFGSVPIIMEYFWTSDNASKWKVFPHLQTYHQVVAIASQIIVGTMLVLRTYALYDQSRIVLALMLCVGFGALGFGAMHWAVNAPFMRPLNSPPL
ncbi:hypothetical protein B0H19DRAFT_936808, partial [Mycena capillaripes]